MPTPPNRQPVSLEPPKVYPLVVVGKILQRLVPVPAEWFSHVAAGNRHKQTQNSLKCQECESYHEVIDAWKKALEWTPGLDKALTVMLATGMSTMRVGEQLWLKILGPPSSGKTTLVEGLALSPYTISKDCIRGFHDGWKDEDGQDRSLASLARGKLLLTKDGDGLLKAPNKDQILAEGRGLYDRVSRTHYRNRKEVDHLGHRMTWLLCGTRALREIDDSELGARFLDCVIMERIDEALEAVVGRQAAYQEMGNMLQESNGEPRKQYPAALAEAMALTGGYLNYLIESADSLYSSVSIGDAALLACGHYGRFVSYMRARPNRKYDEEADREFSARLIKQLTRLAMSVTAVMNKTYADEQVLEIVRQIALDTSRGQSLTIANLLYKHPAGFDHSTISKYLGRAVEKVGILLRFMREIGVIRYVNKTGETTHKPRWQLTPTFRKLFLRVRAQPVDLKR